MTDLPDLPATPPDEGAESKKLQDDINALLPMFWKNDDAPQLSAMLKIIARARAMGTDGFKQLKDLADTLRRTRAFDDLYLLTSEMNANGMADPHTQRWEIQALIELGVYETALELVRPLLEKGVGDKHAREAYGALGRIYKQMYVDGVKDTTPTEEKATLKLYLERGFAAYMHVWENLKTVPTAYHAINAVALAYRAVRDKLVESDPDAEKLAQDVLAMVTGPGEKDSWAKGTQGEALIALGRYDEAAAAYGAYAGQKDIDLFNLGASLRQLEEVWQLDGEDNVKGQSVRVLKAALIAKAAQITADEKAVKTKEAEATLARERAAGGKAPPPVDKPKDKVPPVDLQALVVKLTAKEAALIEEELSPVKAGVAGSARQALQKAFSDDFPVGLDTVLNSLDRASGVCRIHAQRGGIYEAFASGFAIKGSLLHKDWGDAPVIVTNNHVISSQPSRDSRRAEACKAVFVDPKTKAEKEVLFAGVLWESDIEEHDVTVLRIVDGLPSFAKALDKLLPGTLGPHAAQDRDDGIGRCFVIGYPQAKQLAFSYGNNILLDHDAPLTCELVDDGSGGKTCRGAGSKPVHVHYKTATVEGSSGSPVFDADTFTLLGVHHSGSPAMRKLNGRDGTYAANEGIWIYSIRDAIEESMQPATSAEAAEIAAKRRWRAVTEAPKPAPPPAFAPIIAQALPEAAKAAAGTSAFAPGAIGDPRPGLSPVAKQVLHAPGKASAGEIARSGLESVVGPDSRIRIFDTAMTPWRAICSIRARWGARLMVGTGCFIGPNTILTAGHVVFPTDPAALPDEIEIIPGLNGADQPYESVKALKVSVHPRWSGAREIEHDVAAIHLSEPVGERVGWFGVAMKTPDELLAQWAHITGYPGEKFERPPAGPGGREQAPLQATQLWHHSAPIIEVRNRRIFYSVDTTAGQSGAPIYVLHDAAGQATPVVVGVHAYGTSTSPGGTSNSGAWIDDDLFRIIAMWKAESDRILALKRT